jgi:hypothetical protein
MDRVRMSGGACPVMFGTTVSIEPRPRLRAANDRPGARRLAADAILRVGSGTVVLHRDGKSSALALTDYAGVTVDVDVTDEATLGALKVVLAHADATKDVVLFAAAGDQDIVAEWRRFARDLGLPRLIRTETGDEPVERRLGALEVGAPAPRRMSRALLARRPKATRRRASGAIRTRRCG